jgi:hypothetical protein
MGLIWDTHVTRFIFKNLNYFDVFCVITSVLCAVTSQFVKPHQVL